MADTTFVNGVTLTDADWFNDVNRLHYTIFGDPTTKGDARSSIGVTSIGQAKNISLALSVGSDALTISLKGKDGNDPSSTNVVSIPFRNVTESTGDFAVLDVTSSSTLVISSGSTHGAVSNVPFRLWIVMFNDGGTHRLGSINCLSTVAGSGSGRDVTSIYPLSAWGIASSTAEGGAGSADSAQVFYTGTAVTSKAFVVLGYAEWPSGLATAGTWSSGPSRVQLFGPGVPMPGQAVQMVRNDTGASATGTTTIPNDDTIPQNSEGDQYLSQAITPVSSANVLAVNSQGSLASSATGGLTLALFQDSTANALTAVGARSTASGDNWSMRVEKRMLAATTSSTTFKVRGGLNNAGTTTFNGASGSRLYGGVHNSYLEIMEIMG